MIKSVRLVNFFSFGDCTIELEPDLNVLVGINGSGKSNFLRAFQLLKAGMEGRLQEQIAQWGGIDEIRQKNTVRPYKNHPVELQFTISGEWKGQGGDGYEGDITYRVFLINQPNNKFTVDETVSRVDNKVYFDSLGGNIFESEIAAGDNDLKGRTQYGEANELWLPLIAASGTFWQLFSIYRFLRSLDIYRLFNTTEESPMRTTVRATGVDKLLPNGDNMFQVLNVTGLKSTAAYDAIEAGLHDVNEHFQRFRMNVYGQGSVEFYLQEKGLETPIHAAQVSDGTLSYLCLLVALHQPGRGRVVIFDEPERNLHPDMLLELGKQFEKASEQSQLIVTTHAPGLLNQFPLRAVRVFEKDENNQTQVRQFTEESFAGWYEEFAPGQMWRDGALGGNRY
ncbi:AAA family ATPase [uncultured Hymenobacter sp.]|uniref:AAA family ATPase n=1 Tax=uncultured Hymenobacter sp. TaxID=170016 RepID=UPI0035CB8B62